MAGETLHVFGPDALREQVGDGRDAEGMRRLEQVQDGAYGDAYRSKESPNPTLNGMKTEWKTVVGSAACILARSEVRLSAQCCDASIARAADLRF